MYNLDSVLNECKNNNIETNYSLYDPNLKQDMEQLEKEYLDATKQNVSIVRTLKYQIT